MGPLTRLEEHRHFTLVFDSLGVAVMMLSSDKLFELGQRVVSNHRAPGPICEGRRGEIVGFIKSEDEAQRYGGIEVMFDGFDHKHVLRPDQLDTCYPEKKGRRAYQVH